MRWLLIAAALVPLTACATAQRPSEEAVLACVSEAGVAGTFQVTTTLRDSGYEVLLQPGPDVTPAQAEAANQCIARLAEPEPPSAVPAVAAASAATPPEASAPTTVAADLSPSPANATTTVAADAASSPSPAAPCNLEMVGGAGYACAAR